MAIVRKATAVWQGTGLEGKGTLSAPSKFFDNTPYGYKPRFQNEDGTLGSNPEELIAASHAGCFAMALSFAIVGAGFTADELKVDAKVVLEPTDDGFGITGITLTLQGKVSGMGEAQFMELAEKAKQTCPISKALSSVPIHLEASFVS
ncbi:OsmC family protein [Eisenibacter elegans]|jgi:osmotically inducible protein OsmC|uniref:OsmC family protein n=1 Tax=Eisenibacter elegans TaxID=997 RepID=UPI00316ADD7D